MWYPAPEQDRGSSRPLRNASRPSQGTGRCRPPALLWDARGHPDALPGGCLRRGRGLGSSPAAREMMDRCQSKPGGLRTPLQGRAAGARQQKLPRGGENIPPRATWDGSAGPRLVAGGRGDLVRGVGLRTKGERSGAERSRLHLHPHPISCRSLLGGNSPTSIPQGMALSQRRLPLRQPAGFRRRSQRLPASPGWLRAPCDGFGSIFSPKGVFPWGKPSVFHRGLFAEKWVRLSAF